MPFLFSIAIAGFFWGGVVFFRTSFSVLFSAYLFHVVTVSVVTIIHVQWIHTFLLVAPPLFDLCPYFFKPNLATSNVQLPLALVPFVMITNEVIIFYRVAVCSLFTWFFLRVCNPHSAFSIVSI